MQYTRVLTSPGQHGLQEHLQPSQRVFDGYPDWFVKKSTEYKNICSDSEYKKFLAVLPDSTLRKLINSLQCSNSAIGIVTNLAELKSLESEARSKEYKICLDMAVNLPKSFDDATKDACSRAYADLLALETTTYASMPLELTRIAVTTLVRLAKEAAIYRHTHEEQIPDKSINGLFYVVSSYFNRMINAKKIDEIASFCRYAGEQLPDLEAAIVNFDNASKYEKPKYRSKVIEARKAYLSLMSERIPDTKHQVFKGALRHGQNTL